MNPQPSESVGQVIAIILVLMVAYHAVKAYHNNPPIKLNDLDLFTIGYIQSPTQPKPIKTKLKIQTQPVKEAQQIPTVESTQLYIDCVDALHSLGIKKSDAKKTTKNLLSSNNPPKTVQELLIIALKTN